MPGLAAIIAAAILSIIAIAVFSLWGLPFVVLTLVLIGLYVSGSRNRDDSVMEVERNARTEPTGMPRKGSSTAPSANERVGQS